MAIFENNVKRFGKNNTLACKCGSIRKDVQVFVNDVGDRDWILVKCRACGEWLYYNGA